MPEVASSVPPEVIQKAAAAIRAIQETSQLQEKLAIGEVIATQIYGGDLEACRSQASTKATSLRDLALAVGKGSASDLSRAVRVYLLSKDLGGFGAYPDLSYSHYRCVLGLKLEEQKALLAQAQAERIGTMEFEARTLSGKRVAAPATAQAAALAEVHQAMRALQKMLDEKEGLAADLQLVGFPEARVEMLVMTLRSVELQIAAVHDMLSLPKKP